jgi:pimeloyl-ACP methyl ester carboxylesterase
MTVTPFQISIDDDVLEDLRTRLTRTRFTQPSDAQPWAAGTDPGYLRDLIAYWADGFDWRKAEAALNAVTQYTTEINGRRVHFARLRGRQADHEPKPLPLLLAHGWPSSFVEMLRLAPLLTEPDETAGAFDVVIPSLPGFLYSDLPPEKLTRQAMARVWHELMTKTLGYDRYGAFGGDIGGGATQWLGALYPGQVVGVHLIHAPMTDEPATEQERQYLDALHAYDQGDQGYSEIMWTRPDTIAAALADSPAGLAAWIVDKYRDWSDCGGDVSARWDPDTLLTVITLYWATGCIGSSFRSYYDYGQNPPPPRIMVPTAVTLSNEPALAGFPRSLTERRCADLRHWSTPERGGHFMAHEEPEQVARELRTFFGPLRG